MSEKDTNKLVLDFEEKVSFPRKNRGTATFRIVDEDGYVEDYVQRACHSPLLYARTVTPKYVVTLSSIERDKDSSLLFLDWLLNRSPFSEAALTKDPEFAYCHGIVTSADSPSNVMQGVHILYRSLWEGNRVVAYNRLVKEGINESFSFLLSGVVSRYDKFHLYLGVCNHVHASFIYQINKEVVRKFVKNKTNYSNPPYRKKKNYSGVEGAFSHNNNNDFWQNGILAYMEKNFSIYSISSQVIAAENEPFMDEFVKHAKTLEEEWLKSS